MRLSPLRCLKCGTVFTAAQSRYCTCCFADESYLKAAVEVTACPTPAPTTSDAARPASPAA